MIRRRLSAVIAALLFLAPAAAQARQVAGPARQPVVVLRGHGDVEHDIYLRSLLASGDYLLITRDTTITRADTVRTRVLVVGATLRLDGTIAGELIEVAGNVFVRPSATVLGITRNIAGGLYLSQLAHMNAAIENEPNAPYVVERLGDVVTIIGTEHRAPFELPGIKGLSVPTYDRVNGLTLRYGVKAIFPRAGRVESGVHAWGEYYSQRGDFGGGAEVTADRGRTHVSAGAERTTVTNERWIRSDLSNSLAYLLEGKDYRNYYASDRAWLSLGRTLETGRRTTDLTFTAQVEDASPLRAAKPWSITSIDSIRPNDYGVGSDGVRRAPSGRIASGIARMETRWNRPVFELKSTELVEAGIDAFDANATFTRFQLDGEVAMAALRHHTLDVQWHFQGPLGSDTLPWQRWSFVGGSGTLQTFQTAAFSGDRVALVETRYTIPLPRQLTLPLLGRPGLDLLHAVGMAWTQHDRRGWEQNVGVRIGYRVAYIRFMTDPSDFGKVIKTSIGLTMPRKTYPWEVPGPPPQ